MSKRSQSRIRSNERGFTLIELLVVILIIGILAAIALPAFLNQQKKGQDGAAKSDARNLLVQVESCYATENDMSKCDEPADFPNTGLRFASDPYNPAPGQVGIGYVSVGDLGGQSFTAFAGSQTGTRFGIYRGYSWHGNGLQRLCNQPRQGACPANGQW